jgi:hypothetical protein
MKVKIAVILIIVSMILIYKMTKIKYNYIDQDRSYIDQDRSNNGKDISNNGKENFNGDVEQLKSNVDNVNYNIQKGLPNRQEAADRLAAINNTIQKFIRLLQRDHPDSKEVKLLSKRYKPKNIYEGTPLNAQNETSFSVDKGKELTVCLRDKRNTSEFHDENLVLYVIVHELAHIASESYGHNQEFNKNFKWLLKEAIRYNIYKFDDYFINPRQYCGMTISSTIL